MEPTRPSSPGGGSSLARLVSRAPRPRRANWRPRRSRGFHHRLLAGISHTHRRRKGSTRRSTTAGTTWNAGLRPAQPAKGGRREGLPVPRWRRPGGSLSVRRDPYLGVADTVCRSAGHVPAFREGGRQGTARDPGVVVSGPTGRNAHDRSVCTPIPAKNAAALTLAWRRVIRAGFALPRVPAGGRRSKPSPPWRHQLYALSGPSTLSASGRGCYSQATGGRSVSPIHTPSRRSAPAVLRSAVPGWPVQVAAPRPYVRTVPGHRDFQRAPA